MQNPFEIAEHIARRNPLNFNFAEIEPRRAALVVRDFIRMLVNPAIDLHGQPRLDTVEIEDVGTDWVLAAKPRSA